MDFTIDGRKTTTGNSKLPASRVSVLCRQEISKFEVQFFVGGLVVKIPACV